jgi:hypothetical protein
MPSVSFSSKCSLFHNSNVFGSCFIHILYTGCAKIKKNNSGAKRLKTLSCLQNSGVSQGIFGGFYLWNSMVYNVTTKLPNLSRITVLFNPLTPNDQYSGRTAPLTSKRCILYIYSTNIGTEYFKHGIYSPFFLFKMQFVS